MTRSRTSRQVAALLLFAALAGACSGPAHTSEAFCDKLAEFTGPNGVEVTLPPGDPGRIDGVVQELTELHDHAPEEISATTRTLLSFFRSYQQAARDERRDVLAENAGPILEASDALDDYALAECGLFLERAVPTPVPTVNPGIEAPTE